MGQWMDGFLEKLAANRRENEEAGGPEALALQRKLGKLTARERIAHLVDPGSFEELGSLVRDPRERLGELKKPSPSDGVVMGAATVGGRQIMVYAVDYTVMCGSLGEQGVWKMAELVEMAGQQRVPIIGIFDGVGSRITFTRGFAGLYGLSRLIRNYCLYSGVIPQIALVLGPCTGPLAHVPVLSDFLIMNEKTGFLWLGGEMETEDAGRAEFHMTKSGQVDLLAESDEEALDQAKRLLEFMPQNCWHKPPCTEPTDDPERREEALLDVMPDNPKFTYDIHEIIDLIVDDGEFFEIKEDFAPNLVAGFARFDGMPAGIVASNPDELSGIMEPDSSDKYDRFMMFLDNFNIPIINMSDTTAYPPGDKWERMGVIRHGAKNLHGYSNLTNPKVTIVLRRSYGGSNITMGCSKMGPDYIYGWPTVEFAPTGPESIVQAVFHKQLAKAKEEGNYQEVYDFFLNILKEQFSVMNMGKGFTHYYTVHEVIDPRDTRPRIIRALRAAWDKDERPMERRRWIKPA
ncbi:MAG: propionyl-CoA carboxylase [Deltaproteobacteria bacterium]|nr:propionyl-CoA carboxylase [Deltaproteobacteria bacterium]MBW1923421.1 propionyl-CoA carboxylase [Deltaproteobacteria bacterium]MBW1948833.1 propionyl-CoA carboxylase [Deltaproteobacteria bacterium]MBW2008280.1 propionyl-CoA carboxylase [Deltaproteobacteria bacterium]MBW2102073.1 propionyl-CoA carboxylase [Deltaproteobacteria bacterium]